MDILDYFNRESMFGSPSPCYYIPMSNAVGIDDRTRSTAIADDLVHLARIALAGRPQDVEALLQQLVRRYRRDDPSLANALRNLLTAGAVAGSPLRSVQAPAPVDVDSRMSLLRPDLSGRPSVDPILREATQDALDQLRDERLHATRLEEAGLLPSRTALFTGPPGVGKTLTARWLAAELNLPLLILDLSAVMSSLLGRTGANLRRVLDYAKLQPSVLLLDELDSVAKRRNDDTEVGELKRLVTVLIQELDDWPATSLLLAATNHAELLDPAIWRRFDHTVEFDLPTPEAICEAITLYAAPSTVNPGVAQYLSALFGGRSFNDVERMVNAARRRAAIEGTDLNDTLVHLTAPMISQRSQHDRRDLAVKLDNWGSLSQRQISDLTGVSRDTIRRHRSARSPDVNRS